MPPDGYCPKHKCELTGFGPIAWCPICYQEPQQPAADNAVGYFTDMVNTVGALKHAADGLELLQDLEWVKQDVLDVFRTSLRQQPLVKLEVKIYAARRIDGLPFNWEPLQVYNNVVMHTLALVGFPGCSWARPNWIIHSGRNVPLAQADDAPTLILTEADV